MFEEILTSYYNNSKVETFLKFLNAKKNEISKKYNSEKGLYEYYVETSTKNIDFGDAESYENELEEYLGTEDFQDEIDIINEDINYLKGDHTIISEFEECDDGTITIQNISL